MDDDEIILALLEESFEEQHEMRRMITPSHTAKYLISNGVTIRKHGRWEKASEMMPIYRCSVCKERNLFKNGDNVFSNYCPNCGAKMDEEENHD
jgi:DNA-directed RNA polymerase subunit RPC12/RpoP